MTEDEWLTSNEPRHMWSRITGGTCCNRHADNMACDCVKLPRVSDRKQRLFQVAICRQPGVWSLLDDWTRKRVALVEGYAEREDPGILATEDLQHIAIIGICQCNETCPYVTQAAILRDVVGNPWKPIKASRDWRTPLVVSLAEACYTERLCVWKGRSHDHDEETGWEDTGTIDPARLSILADACEDAGCPDEAILRHLRGFEPVVHSMYGEWPEKHAWKWKPLRGPHVRGCHVVDAILGKE